MREEAAGWGGGEHPGLVWGGRSLKAVLGEGNLAPSPSGLTLSALLSSLHLQ